MAEGEIHDDGDFSRRLRLCPAHIVCSGGLGFLGLRGPAASESAGTSGDPLPTCCPGCLDPSGAMWGRRCPPRKPHKGKSLRLFSLCLFSFSKNSCRFNLHRGGFFPPVASSRSRLGTHEGTTPHTPWSRSDHTRRLDGEGSLPGHGSERGVLACHAWLPRPGEPVWPLSGGQKPEGAGAGTRLPAADTREGPALRKGAPANRPLSHGAHRCLPA